MNDLPKKAMLLLMDFSIMSLVVLGIAFCRTLEYACLVSKEAERKNEHGNQGPKLQAAA